MRRFLSACADWFLFIMLLRVIGREGYRRGRVDGRLEQLAEMTAILAERGRRRF